MELNKSNLEKIIQNINDTNFHDQAKNLFKSMGYYIDFDENYKARDINLYATSDYFEDFIDQTSLHNFFTDENRQLIQSICLLNQFTDEHIEADHFQFKDELIDRQNFNSFLFFSIELHSQTRRSKLAELTRLLNKEYLMPVNILFKHGNYLSFATILHKVNQKDDSKDILGKVSLLHEINISKPHSAHLDCLLSLSLSEIIKNQYITNFVQLHRYWREILSTELLTKKFYKDICNWYFWTIDYCQFPKQTNKEEAVLRLLSRFMFVWFMKEGKLIPNELFDPKSLHQYLKQNPATHSTESNYYKAIIQNLFFATLNAPLIDEHTGEHFRRFIQPDDTQHLDLRYRYADLFEDQQAFLKLMETIPFLNGGLFDALSLDLYHDGFDENLEIQSELNFPNFLFFQEEKTNYNPLNDIFGTINKRYDVQGLIYILNRYKFTVTENTPLEQDIALDPELLGRIFEGLLAYFNKESDETARKTTGSFYTPKEVVNHMVEESLIKYFINYIAKRGGGKITF